MQHFTVNLRQHIIYLTMAGCTLQFTMLILYNEHKSNNNTIYIRRDRLRDLLQDKHIDFHVLGSYLR